MNRTVVHSAAEEAGVVCPAKNEKWAKRHNCNDCKHQQKCYAAVMRALGL